MWGFMEPNKICDQREIEEGCKLMAVNFRKEVETEFLQLCYNMFNCKHKWPKGLFKASCIKIVEVEDFFPNINKLIYWGGKIQKHYELSKPLESSTGETVYLSELPALIGGPSSDEEASEKKKVHPKIQNFFEQLEAFKAKRKAEELGKRDRSKDPEMLALEALRSQMQH